MTITQNLNKTTVVFIHGTFGSPDDFKATIGHLKKHDNFKDFSIDLIALPGHDSNPISETEDLWQQMVHAVKSGIRDKNTVVIAYSLGGRVALQAIHELVLAEENMCQALILEGVHPGLQTDSERQERTILDRERAEKIRTQPTIEFLENWYSQPLFGMAHDPKAIAMAAHDRARTLNKDAIARVFVECSPGVVPPRWDFFSTYPNPILYVAGAKDAKYQALAAELAQIAPSLRTAIVEEAGHNAHRDQPEDFARIIGEFLEHAVKP